MKAKNSKVVKVLVFIIVAAMCVMPVISAAAPDDTAGDTPAALTDYLPDAYTEGDGAGSSDSDEGTSAGELTDITEDTPGVLTDITEQTGDGSDDATDQGDANSQETDKNTDVSNDSEKEDAGSLSDTGKKAKDAEKPDKSAELKVFEDASQTLMQGAQGAVLMSIAPTDVASIGDTGYATLQAAVDAAVTGDTISLLKDISENVKIYNKTVTVDLCGYTATGIAPDYSPVSVTGGSVTVKNGTLTGGRGLRRVQMQSGYGARLYPAASGAWRGNLVGTNAAVTLENVSLTGSKGNALAANNCNLTVTNCDISGNNGNTYTIVHIEGGSAFVKDTAITNNTNTYDTVAVIDKASAVFENCEISGNSAQYVGGLLVGSAIADQYAGDVTLRNTTITKNYAKSSISATGGLCIWYGAFKMENSTIAGNTYSGSPTKYGANDILLKRWTEGSYIQKADTMPGNYAGYSWISDDDTVYADAITYGIYFDTTPGATFAYSLTAEKAETDPVAEYNGAEYPSLSKAVAAAIADNAADKLDKTVKLLKDTKDNIAVASGVNFAGTLEMDLGGHTVSSKKPFPVFKFECGGGGTIYIHDGNIENGENSSSSLYTAGGILFDTGSGSAKFSNLKIENIVFEKNMYNQVYVQTAGNVEISGSEFTGGTDENIRRYGVVLRKATDLTVKNCSFHDAGGALYIMGIGGSALVENTTFNNNTYPASLSSSMLIVYVSVGSAAEAIFTNCDFSNNTLFGSGAPCVIKVDSSGNTEFNGCTIKNNKHAGNYNSGNTNATVIVTGNAHFKNSEISGNTFLKAGAISMESGSAKVELTDTVIKNNTAMGYTSNVASYMGSAGGVNLYGGTLTFHSGAIYDNEIQNVGNTDKKANDLFISKSGSFNSGIKASEMTDGAVGFSSKMWKDANSVGFEDKPAVKDASAVRFYTVTDYYFNPVAKVGDQEFLSIQETIDAASPGDIVYIISAESALDTAPLTIDKDITFDFNGRNIRLDRAETGTNLFDISGNVIFKNTRNEKYNKGGITRGGVTLGNSASLTVEDDMAVTSFVHESEKLCFNGIPEGTINVTLGKGKFITLGDRWKTEADYNKTTLNITLHPDDLAAINAGGVDHKIVDSGSESELRLITVNGLGDRVIKTIKKKDASASTNSTSNVVNKLARLKAKTANGNDDGDIYLHYSKGVYLSGSGNDANGRGFSPTAPVKTFARAKQLLLADPELEGIYIVGTVYIEGDQTWEMPEGETRPIYRYPDFNDNKSIMIQVDSYYNNVTKKYVSGKLTLKNIIIDGQKDQIAKGATTMINVRNGLLIIDEGAELRNNNAVDTSADHSLHSVHGGAVLCEQQTSRLEMRGGSIHDNEAFFGGGIFVGHVSYNNSVYEFAPKFIMTGGVIENNRAVFRQEISNIYREYAKDGRSSTNGYSYPNATGGGVMLAFGTTMNMYGGIIRNNTADSDGGGIALGNKQDYYCDPGRWGPSNAYTTLNMYGGTIEGNTASNGGGIYVQCYTVANLYEGNISNNSTGSDTLTTYPRGGGIYVNGYYKNAEVTNGKLFIHNPVEMTGNTSLYGGSAIMTCGTSRSFIRDINGAAIHDNGPANSQVLFSSVMETVASEGFFRDPSYISEYMPGGGEYMWTDGSGLVDADVLHTLPKSQFLYTAQDAGTPDMQAAIDMAKVHINNNSTHGGGGAIGANGELYIGKYMHRTDVTVLKTWNDYGSESMRPASIKVFLLRDGAVCDSAEIYPDSADVWSCAFTDLPRYKINPETGEETTEEYVYTIMEDGYGIFERDGVVYIAVASKLGDTSRAHTVSVDPEMAAPAVFVQNWKLVNTPAKPCYDNPSVNKSLEGSPEKPEKFTFVLTPVSNTAKLALSEMPMPNDAEGGEAEVSITGKGSAEFGEIKLSKPGEYVYQVTEKNGGKTGYAYDNSVYTIKYTVTVDGDKLVYTKGISKDGFVLDTVEFRNVYAPPTPCYDDPPVKKTVLGSPKADETFTFVMTPVSNTAGLTEMPLPNGATGEATASVTGAGEVEFGEIEFTEAGEYVYKVVEKNTGAENYAYDTGEYIIKYDIKLDGNALVMQKTVTKDGSEKQDIVFKNTYTDPTVPIKPCYDDPPVKKTVVGSPKTPAEFTFVMTPLSNTADLSDMPLPNGAEGEASVSITGAGEIELGDIEFKEAGEYVYKVAEKNTGNKDYIYDTSVYTVKYTVTLEGDTLVSAREITKDGERFEKPEFVNRLKEAAPPNPPEDSGTPSTTTAKVSPQKTGDDTDIMMLIIIAAASAAALALAVIVLRVGNSRSRHVKRR